MKATIAAVIISLALIVGAGILSRNTSSANTNTGENNEPAKNNVIVTAGAQVVEITAKGGFSPRKSLATAGLPTTLRVDTNGTFDCSSAIRIPSLNISKNLPPSGVTDIDLGTPTAGTLYGTCGMGMYPFEIQFN